MGKSTKIAKLRKDKYYKLAKETGYRSRAAFKLIQLNRKYEFLNRAQAVVDLCAAPGGWLQVCANVMPMSSTIIGVDLAAIKPIKNCSTFVCDITTPECIHRISQLLGGAYHSVDCVLHDGAPNVGKNWENDAFAQSQLTLHAIRLAFRLLKPNGDFVTKIFRSRDYDKLIDTCKLLFKQVHATKPMASRKESAEIFVVCRGFVGHKNVDKSVLEFKNVFVDETEQEIRAANPLYEEGISIKKFFKLLHKKRNREGYTEASVNSGLLYKEIGVDEFVRYSGNPLHLLVDCNRIVFKTGEYEYEIDENLKRVCDDVKCAGLKEITDLISWRNKCRQKLKMVKKDKNETNEKIEKKEQTEVDPVEEVEREMRRQEKKKLKNEKKQEKQMKSSSKQLLQSNVDMVLDEGVGALSDIDLDEAEDLSENDNEDEDEDEETSSEASSSDELTEQMEENVDRKMKMFKQTDDYLKSLDEEFVKNQQELKEQKKKLKAEKNIIVGDVEHFEDLDDKKENNKKEEANKIVVTPELIALANKIKRSKKNLESVVDDCYNRFYNGGEEDLPAWFADDEKLANRHILPVSKSESDYYKNVMKEARLRREGPNKKELEQKMRKKKKVEKIAEAARKKAETIFNEETEKHNDGDKIDSLKTMYKKANKMLNKKQEKKYIVARKVSGGKFTKPRGVKGPVKIVDARMKKDKRAAKRANTKIRNNISSKKNHKKTRHRKRK